MLELFPIFGCSPSMLSQTLFDVFVDGINLGINSREDRTELAQFIVKVHKLNPNPQNPNPYPSIDHRLLSG